MLGIGDIATARPAANGSRLAMETTVQLFADAEADLEDEAWRAFG